ncbi:hypothetical protein l13_04450 [Neisseria weaveri ATCC 51223]|nr:hypothetical protein l13_04450 [Neisseria weaveri ATCC 51223]
MLKLPFNQQYRAVREQPPSGGCVLKPYSDGRGNCSSQQPPSGGCVLKHSRISPPAGPAPQPPSGGCVLKLLRFLSISFANASRLRAAVC